VRRSGSYNSSRRDSGRRGSHSHSGRGGPLSLVFGLLVAIGVIVVIAMAYSGGHGLDGDPGRVHDKDKSYRKSSSWDYDLEVTRSKDGTSYWIDVSQDVYDDCVRGAKYPACGQDD
jgi:hypothetical protein